MSTGRNTRRFRPKWNTASRSVENPLFLFWTECANGATRIASKLSLFFQSKSLSLLSASHLASSASLFSYSLRISLAESLPRANLWDIARCLSVSPALPQPYPGFPAGHDGSPDFPDACGRLSPHSPRCFASSMQGVEEAGAEGPRLHGQNPVCRWARTPY